MKMLVIGSSDTGGASLPDPSQAWPNLVGAELEPFAGEPIEVINLPVVWAGPKAVPRITGALDKHSPDLVVFAYGAYGFIIATVGQRVRRHYGERVYRWFRAVEVRFESKTESKDGDSARLNHFGRWLARRVIGAEPLTTRDETFGLQSEALRELAQREDMTVVMLGAPPIGDNLERENRGANAKLDAHREAMTAVGRGYHFLIADCLPGFAAAQGGSLRHSDGIHKGAAGHRIQADSIMETLRTPPSPWAVVAEATHAPEAVPAT